MQGREERFTTHGCVVRLFAKHPGRSKTATFLGGNVNVLQDCAYTVADIPTTAIYRIISIAFINVYRI